VAADVPQRRVQRPQARVRGGTCRSSTQGGATKRRKEERPWAGHWGRGRAECNREDSNGGGASGALLGEGGGAPRLVCVRVWSSRRATAGTRAHTQTHAQGLRQCHGVGLALSGAPASGGCTRPGANRARPPNKLDTHTLRKPACCPSQPQAPLQRSRRIPNWRLWETPWRKTHQQPAAQSRHPRCRGPRSSNAHPQTPPKKPSAQQAIVRATRGRSMQARDTIGASPLPPLARR
jgi:hypothetical protein